MNEGFWPIAFALGAAQGGLLCIALFLRRSANRTPTRLLAAIVGVFATMIFGGMLSATLSDPFEDLVVFLNINTELAIGPLLLLFARSLVDPRRPFGRRDTIHFAPLLLASCAWVLAWAVLGDGYARREFLASPFIPVYVALKACWLFAYVIPTLRVLGSEISASRKRDAGKRSVRLAWVRNGFVLLAGMAALIYLTDFADRFGVNLPIEPDPFASLVLAVMIYLASWTVLQRPWVLSLQPLPAIAGDRSGETARLTSYLNRERPWLRPELGLGDLARALGSTEHRVSTILREGLDTNFYALINRHRLTEFERLARDPDQRNRSVLELAYEAGFNSKAAFYRVFREAHGTTPTAFRQAS